ncbi:unnamed protein product [Coffea canephora]|uniref:Bulb-type lectin domain-containing protein n=1 Tax=Coffea canephora TaxID=49390 RepID=A0A068TQI4_COFCA|nr:unnamed protein product [Coffea canephora]
MTCIFRKKIGEKNLGYCNDTIIPRIYITEIAQKFESYTFVNSKFEPLVIYCTTLLLEIKFLSFLEKKNRTINASIKLLEMLKFHVLCFLIQKLDFSSYTGIARMISSSNRNLVTFSCIIAYFVAKKYSVSGAKDTLGVSESLKLHNGEILESSNKRYRFLSDHSSSFLVIQFVYLNHSINVWAANSYLAAPAMSRISAITMNESGRLEVYGHGNSDAAVFTVNAEQKVMIGKTSATLLDNGNLVLRSRSGHTVWQSFDYPSHHTWLSSGMKLGISLLSQRSTTCCLQRAASGPSLAPSPGSPSFPVGPSLAPASGSPSFPVGPSRSPAPGSTSLPPGPPSGRKKSKNLRVKPYVVGAAIATFLVSLVLLFWCCKLQKRKGNHRKFMRPGRPQLDDKGDDESLFFSFTSIEIATDHFSEENKLGQGGFGPVFKVS